MHKGSVVRSGGKLFIKGEMSQWYYLLPEFSRPLSEEAVLETKHEVLYEAEEDVADLAMGSVIAGADGSIVAVKQFDDDWTMSQDEEWFTTEEMLRRIGKGWKVIYRA